ARMTELGVDVLCCSVGPELPYLVGYQAMPLERLTMLVVPRDAAAVLVVPRLEAPRVEDDPDAFTLEAWEETDDPIARVATHVGAARVVAIGDQTWARFVLALQQALPGARFCSANDVVGPLRVLKDPDEVERLGRAANAVDEIAVRLRESRLVGRTEHDVAREIAGQILDAGHERVNFVIVASGPNGASPHHDPGPRVIKAGDVVLCDFGGTMQGYCSDITRMYVAGDPTTEVREAYDALTIAQETAVRAAIVGTPCEAVDAAARHVLVAAGLGERFVHRTGHGIGMDAHEDPYVVQGNATPLAPGHAFSIEPGVYVPGRFGLRLEDIVVATPDGPLRLNDAPRDLAVVA
ncbi:MAG TPA: Xaa-Pro peptidase family protein, partial [Acidimicrobiia bacterium]